MPGYGGGVGADTDGDNADYGEGMGTKGAAASDNSIGMGSESDKDFGNTVEGFRAALAKALGQVTQAQKDTAVEAQEKAANQLEAKNLQELDGGAGSMDTDKGLLGSSVDDPQGTQKGLDAEQEARDAIGRSQRSDQEKAMNEAVAIGAQRTAALGDPEKEGFRGLENKAMGSTVENDVDRQAFENAMKESVQAYRDISGELGHPDFGFSGTPVEGSALSGLESAIGGPSLGDPGQSIGDRNTANRNRRAALALESFNNLEQTVKRDPNLTERERARKLAAIQATKRTTEYGILVGYAFPGQTIAGIKTSTLARALASLLGLGVPMGIMSVLDKTLGKKGFGQVERDALTSIARDIEESGGSSATAGYGGGSDETKRKFYEYIIQVEPWAKGLSDRQINYYLENEEELEWVRNLYKDMTNA